FEAMQARKSVRAYDSTPVPKEVLRKLLEAAQIAPSASNIQPWHFIVVTEKEKREKLSQGRYAKFLSEAPVVIVGCGDQEASPKWHVVDVAIALEHIVLAATNEGLGTCWVGSFDEPLVKETLKIPKNYRIVALLAVGYPREKLVPIKTGRPRKSLEQIASFEEYPKPA
ncbi:MAG: nitroreductase family protein, partial [Candidatus Bathyarchaeia archaeon]